MKKSNFRSSFLHMNKYQKKILLLSFVPCALLSLFMCLMLRLFFNDFGNALLSRETVIDIAYVKHWSLLIMGSMWCFFVVLVVWVSKQSNHLVGAFERVKKELQDVSEGRRKKPITVRKKDHLFKEILESINVIIQKLYE